MFEGNDVICFLGDSITADGRWIAEIYDNVSYGVKIYNCGVAGDTAERALKRIYNDCLIFSPDYVVVMFGMNDIGRELYITEKDQNEKEMALKKYEESMTEIAQRCQKSGTEVIICTPTPYDEVSDGPTVKIECNIGIDKCRDLAIKIAEKYNCMVVDFNAILNSQLGKISCISDDRVHPNALGHHIMAQIFLEATNLKIKADFSSKFEMSEKNKQRFEIEQILRGIAFVEWCSLYEDKQVRKLTIEQKKDIIKQRYSETDGLGYVAEMWKLYLDNVDFKDDILEKLIEKTV